MGGRCRSTAKDQILICVMHTRSKIPGEDFNVGFFVVGLVKEVPFRTTSALIPAVLADKAHHGRFQQRCLLEPTYAH